MLQVIKELREREGLEYAAVERELAQGDVWGTRSILRLACERSTDEEIKRLAATHVPRPYLRQFLRRLGACERRALADELLETEFAHQAPTKLGTMRFYIAWYKQMSPALRTRWLHKRLPRVLRTVEDQQLMVDELKKKARFYRLPEHIDFVGQYLIQPLVKHYNQDSLFMVNRMVLWKIGLDVMVARDATKRLAMYSMGASNWTFMGFDDAKGAKGWGPFKLYAQAYLNEALIWGLLYSKYTLKTTGPRPGTVEWSTYQRLLKTYTEEELRTITKQLDYQLRQLEIPKSAFSQPDYVDLVLDQWSDAWRLPLTSLFEPAVFKHKRFPEYFDRVMTLHKEFVATAGKDETLRNPCIKILSGMRHEDKVWPQDLECVLTDAYQPQFWCLPRKYQLELFNYFVAPNQRSDNVRALWNFARSGELTEGPNMDMVPAVDNQIRPSWFKDMRERLLDKPRDSAWIPLLPLLDTPAEGYKPVKGQFEIEVPDLIGVDKVEVPVEGTILDRMEALRQYIMTEFQNLMKSTVTHKAVIERTDKLWLTKHKNEVITEHANDLWLTFLAKKCSNMTDLFVMAPLLFALFPPRDRFNKVRVIDFARSAKKRYRFGNLPEIHPVEPIMIATMNRYVEGMRPYDTAGFYTGDFRYNPSEETLNALEIKEYFLRNNLAKWIIEACPKPPVSSYDDFLLYAITLGGRWVETLACSGLAETITPIYRIWMAFYQHKLLGANDHMTSQYIFYDGSFLWAPRYREFFRVFFKFLCYQALPKFNVSLNAILGLGNVTVRESHYDLFQVYMRIMKPTRDFVRTYPDIFEWLLRNSHDPYLLKAALKWGVPCVKFVHEWMQYPPGYSEGFKSKSTLYCKRCADVYICIRQDYQEESIQRRLIQIGRLHLMAALTHCIPDGYHSKESNNMLKIWADQARIALQSPNSPIDNQHTRAQQLLEFINRDRLLLSAREVVDREEMSVSHNCFWYQLNRMKHQPFDLQCWFKHPRRAYVFPYNPLDLAAISDIVKMHLREFTTDQLPVRGRDRPEFRVQDMLVFLNHLNLPQLIALCRSMKLTEERIFFAIARKRNYREALCWSQQFLGEIEQVPRILSSAPKILRHVTSRRVVERYLDSANTRLCRAKKALLYCQYRFCSVGVNDILDRFPELSESEIRFALSFFVHQLDDAELRRRIAAKIPEVTPSLLEKLAEMHSNGAQRLITELAKNSKDDNLTLAAQMKSEGTNKMRVRKRWLKWTDLTKLEALMHRTKRNGRFMFHYNRECFRQKRALTLMPT